MAPLSHLIAAGEGPDLAPKSTSRAHHHTTGRKMLGAVLRFLAQIALQLVSPDDRYASKLGLIAEWYMS